MSLILNVEHVDAFYAEGRPHVFLPQKKIQVLHDVSFSIRKNEFFGLVGESGCGKSTLGKAILGLMPFEGTITVDGLSYSKKNKKSFARNVQAVFQDPLGALNPKKTIGFTMEEPLRIHAIGTHAERVRQVCRMLELVGLDESYLGRYPAELSGGQRQRVCIGASLMLRPRLIISDEAISALDVSIGAQILNLFREIHQKLELSQLFISHNLNVVRYLCDRIAVMYRGYIVELGTAEELYDYPSHPYTRLLLSAVPEISRREQDKDQTLELLKPNIEGACCFYHRCPHAEGRCMSTPQLAPLQGKQEAHLVRCWKADRVSS